MQKEVVILLVCVVVNSIIRYFVRILLIALLQQ
nr:MAG TPA: hypothetical protein [Caudoviricetes sp.]